MQPDKAMGHRRAQEGSGDEPDGAEGHGVRYGKATDEPSEDNESQRPDRIQT
jgi:hypothetical protein